ncbi:uncharacterized protein [Chelonus insularis]|uniref:uncharacterized protein isoform X2 n=1 Tax=Chelonus insularis TaxID=460826 RepID=UPI001588B276|nr:uncharacterized protein LOC118064437 isoform X2 [Chelonus insularis]
MGKVSVAKSSQSKSKRSSSANTLSKPSKRTYSNGIVRDNLLQTYPVLPVKTRSKQDHKMKTIESVEVSKTTVMNHIIKNVKIYLVDLIHTNLLTRKHRKKLQKLKERKPKMTISVCSSFDSHYSDISASSIRINDRELRSLPVRDERVKRESLFLKYIQEPNSSFSNLNRSQGGGNVSIVDKFRQKESQVEAAKNDEDEEKKWRFWNGDIFSDGSSRRGTVSITSYESSDIFSSEESEIEQKRKRRRTQTKKLPPSSSKQVLSGNKKKNKPKTPSLDKLPAAADKTSQASTSSNVIVEAAAEIQTTLLSSIKLNQKEKKNREPEITMRRTVVTWSGDKKTTWILNVMPKSEAERTGKLEKLKQTRLERNPLRRLKPSSPKKRGPYKKRIKEEKKKEYKSKKPKIEEKLLCCDGPCKCNPEDDLVVHKLPSMPAIDTHLEAKKQMKSDLSIGDESKSSSKKDTNKREISSVNCDTFKDLPNSEPPSKLRKLNDGKKHPEIIEDTVLPPGSVVALISPIAKNLKTLGRIPKIDPNIKAVSDEKLKVAFDNWAKIPELIPLISPTTSIVSCKNKIEVEKKTPTSTGSIGRSKIVYDIKNNDQKPVPLTRRNIELFSKMIKNQLKNDVEGNKMESRVRLRISRFNKKEDDSNNNNVMSDGVKSKKNRRDWKKESSQVNDGSNSSTESSPTMNKYTRCNSDDSLPRFGQILPSTSNPSTSDTPIEKRVLDWIRKDLDISDDKNINDLDLSDNSSSISSEALKIDVSNRGDNKTNQKEEVDSSVLEINHLISPDTSIENVTFADQSIVEGKSVNESTENLDDTRQSVAGEDDEVKQKDDDTSSISSSSSSDSNKSSDSSSSSSSSSASSRSSSSSSIISNVNKSLKIVEPEKSPSKVQESSVCINDKTEPENKGIDNQDVLEILDNDKCDDDKGYVSIIDDNNSINNSNNSNINDKSIDEEKSLKVDDKSNDSQEEKRLESGDEEKRLKAEKNDEKRIEIDSVLDDNDNIEKNKLIESESNNGLEDLEEDEKDESDCDAISLYAESLFNDKPDEQLVSPELPTFGDLSRPSSPQNGYNRMESNTFDNYCQLTEQEFDNDYQNVNIQTDSKGLTTRRFRNQSNKQNNNQTTNNGHVECDSSYARSPNSHTIHDDNLDRFNSYSAHQIDSNYNIVRNKKLHQNYEQNFTKQRNVFDPEVKKSNPTKDFVKQFFYGNCFQHLKTGNCTKVDKCRHNHTIGSKLERIYLETPEKIHMTLIYAFEQNFHFYIRIVYCKAIVRLDIQTIFNFFGIILLSNVSKREMVPDYIRWTIDALLAKNRTLKNIINVLSIRIAQMGKSIKPVMAPGEVCNIVISHLATKINAGCYWETFRCLIYNQVSLSSVIISYILQESIEFNKPLSHLKDIMNFLDSYLSDEENFTGINPELFNKFTLLLHEQTIKEQKMHAESVVEIRQKPPEAISLASPDTMDINNLPDNVNPFISSINTNKYIPERDLIPLQDNNNNDNNNLKTKSVINSVDIRQKTQEKVEDKRDAVPSTSKMNDIQECASESLFANKYKLIPIDAPKSKSVYESYVWLLRSDLENIQTAIKKNDYDEIIKVLSVNKRSQSQPFVRGFYTILCREIMESVRHLNEIIQRTGNNLMLGDVQKWKLKSTNVKKALKLHGHMMRVLFQALTYFYPQYAVELCRKILDEQQNTFYPINLTRVITDIINTVLTDIINTDNNNIENIEYIYTELSKVILSHNVIIYDELLRNIIIEVYHTDEKLSRQLFKYATQMGIYTTVKYQADFVATLTIDINLSEEEMYLLLAESFKSLKEQIGCNIYILQPQKLFFYLNLEDIPSKKMLHKDRIKLKNNVQIMKSTKAILGRVFEKFNPKLKMLSRTVGQRICRLVSNTVFPHLIKDDD